MFQPFTESDQEIFPGAEPFSDGRDPIITWEATVDGQPTAIVVDGQGIAVMTTGEDNEDLTWGLFDGPMAARWLALNLKSDLTFVADELADAGFQVL
jgi:hypothetical protein